MSAGAPRWLRWLLARLAGPARADEVVGDLEEAHRERLGRHGRVVASLLTVVEAADMALALVRVRRTASWSRGRGAAVRARDAARRRRPSFISWLDVKLGARMLVKHPWLSVVSVAGMAVAVAIGATSFGVIRAMTSSPLPLHEGDRVVAVANVGPFAMSRARSTHLHALERWREAVPAVAEWGAYRTVSRNVFMPDGGVAPARIAEMTASGFRITRVPPLLGRPLLDEDEADGAPPVVVIGHGVWQDRFGGRPDVVGRTLQVGAVRHEIVGVMPRGYAFPVDDRLWTPLRLAASDYAMGEAPPVEVFGRLAPGASLAEAAEQLRVVGERLAAEHPALLDDVRPLVLPYTEARIAGPVAWAFRLIRGLVHLLLLVIFINVAALVYARTVTRTGEIAVRSAMGASRGRIAWQLFAESLLLSVAAAAAGLLVARAVVERLGVHYRATEGTPFWWDFGLTPAVYVYALVLAAAAAAIIGVVPALGATGRRLRAGLQRVGAGASTPRLGKTWTALIVLQIALAVAILPLGLSGAGRWSLLDTLTDSRFPLDDVLVAQLEIDDGASAASIGSAGSAASAGPAAGEAAGEDAARLRDALVRRLEAQGEVARVAVMPTPPWRDPDLGFEMDAKTAAPLAGTPGAMASASSGHRVGRSRVSPAFFEALDIPVLSGRGLTESDAAAPHPPVVVNRTFVDRVMGGADPIGRSIRFLTPWDPDDDREMEDRWHTIVGVVPNVQPSIMSNPEATAYIPVPATEPGPVHLAVRVRAGVAAGYAPQLRRIAAEVDPRIRLEELETLQARAGRGQGMWRLMILTVAALSLSVLLLAVAGLYALMSFTVARRRREIGIRTALGARPRRVLRSILARAATQLALGIVVGLGLALVLDRLAGGELIGGREAVYVPLVVLLMATIGGLAAWGPARRGLRVQPTEALRAE